MSTGIRAGYPDLWTTCYYGGTVRGMANTYPNSMSDRAITAGLSLTVELSKDLDEQLYTLTRPDGMAKSFASINDAWRWLDGYLEGLAQATCAERAKSVRAELVPVQ